MKYAFALVFLAVIGVLARGGGAPNDVAGYARQLQSRVGAKVGIGRVAAVDAEGDTLVVTFDGPENWRMGQLSYVLTAPFLEGFCDSGRAKPYFHDGRKIRLDTLEAGRRRVRGDPVSRCPQA
jgi:hypothetical protein